VNILKRADAISLGLKQYFTGKPCPRGHVANRYVNGKGCIECSAAFRLRWAKENPDKASLQKKRQYVKHKKEIKHRRAAYRQANREKISERKRESYQQNRAHVLESVRRYAANNREALRLKNKRWRENNRDLVATIDRLKRCRRKGAIGAHTADDIRDIAKLQGNKCAYCRVSLLKKKRHVDHIIPVVRGGTNDRANIQLLCEFCNLSKHARDPIDFAQSRGLLL
jgi:5-methylcytosine-specific restriction endonuclease McrA